MDIRPAAVPGSDHHELAKGLASAVDCQVLLPGEDRYQDSIAVFNRRVANSPAAVVRVRDVGHVARVVSFCGAHGLSPSVLAGGHGLLGHAVAGDVVIDLGHMRDISVDADNHLAGVEAGARWRELDAAAWSCRLVTPGARISDIGVTGFALGGGEGWLSRQYGLAADNLVRAQLVTAAGSVITVDDDTEPSLMACLRGAGGNFGVVTKVWQRLHRPKPVMLSSRMIFAARHAASVSYALEEYLHEHPKSVSASLNYCKFRDGAEVPEDIRGKCALVLNVLVLSDSEPTARRQLDAFSMRVAAPAIQSIGVRDYPEIQAELDAHHPRGERQQSAAVYLPELSDAVIGKLSQGAVRSPGAHAQLTIKLLDGAITHGDSASSVFPQRRSVWALYIMSRWSDASEDHMHIDWVREVKQSLAPQALPGAYLNMDDDHSPEAVQKSFGRQTYRRLATAKQQWDAQNVFRHNANIMP